MLAYYHYPFDENNNYTEYIEDDLSNPEKLQELFDYCQILEAYITYDGWKFLVKKYGFKKLFEINNKSGWIDADNIQEYQSWIEQEMQTLLKSDNKT